MRYRPIEERFAEKYVIDEATGCWLWTGAKTRGGYGMLGRHRQHATTAHRFSYEHHVGEIPTGHVVRHSCHNPLCVNPAHLVVGSHADNMMDMTRSGRARILSSDQVEEIVRLSEVHSINGIARLYSVDRSTIQRVLAKARDGDFGPVRSISNGDKEHVSLSEFDKEEAISLLRSGERVMAVAKKFGVDRKTIRNLRPDDVPSPPIGRPKQTEKDTPQ